MSSMRLADELRDLARSPQEPFDLAMLDELASFDESGRAEEPQLLARCRQAAAVFERLAIEQPGAAVERQRIERAHRDAFAIGYLWGCRVWGPAWDSELSRITKSAITDAVVDSVRRAIDARTVSAVGNAFGVWDELMRSFAFGLERWHAEGDYDRELQALDLEDERDAMFEDPALRWLEQL